MTFFKNTSGIILLLYFFNLHIAISIRIYYNASRQKRSEVLQAVRQQKTPVLEHWGFSIPNFGNGRA